MQLNLHLKRVAIHGRPPADNLGSCPSYQTVLPCSENERQSHGPHSLYFNPQANVVQPARVLGIPLLGHVNDAIAAVVRHSRV
jgi:hypothetical protein